MILRPYQIEQKNQIREIFSKGKKRVILQAPTGSGKTVTFSDMAASSVEKGKVPLISVDRIELLEQAESKLKEYGLNPIVITGSRTQKKRGFSYVSTVQTLMRRDITFQPDIHFIDEAHKQIFDKLFTRKELKDIHTVGVTATPLRKGKMTPLSSIYQDMVNVISIAQLIEGGFLVPCRTLRAKIDTSRVKHKGDEFDEGEAFKFLDKKVLYDDVVGKYLEYCHGEQGICFCQNVEHSIKTAEEFNKSGVRAAHVDGTTPTALRSSIIKQFKMGLIDMLCNCDIFTTGFDAPNVRVVILNRMTESLPLYLQMAGRGSRPYEDKTHFTLLDMGGNFQRFQFWEMDREWDLFHKRRDKEGAAPVKDCPECESMNYASAKICKWCGYDFPEKVKQIVIADFEEVKSPIQMPAVKKIPFDIADLEEYRRVNDYKVGWLVNVLKNRPDPLRSLETYGAMKGYSRNWYLQMAKTYNIKIN